MTEPLTLSIIIINYNTLKLLDLCLNSIYTYPPQSHFEIIVVDNCSTDGSGDMVRSKYPQVKLITNPANYGFARANNTGIKAAGGKYILLLNSDTECMRGSLDTLIGYMENNPDSGIVGPLLLGTEHNIIQMSWGWYPTIIKELFQKMLSPQHIAKNIFIKLLAHQLLKHPREVELISGACMLIRKEVFSTVGYLDENIFLYFEEPDFCLRVKLKNWKIYFLPEARIIHKLGQSMKKIDHLTHITHYIKSQLYFYKKYNPRWQQKFLKYYILLKYTLKYFYDIKKIKPIVNLLKGY